MRVRDYHPPQEVASNDPEVLRAALIRESLERRRAECRASMQTEVVKLALDLLVREPDIEGFFGGLAKTMVEESESHTCAVWLLDESEQRCDLWLAYVKDRLFTPPKGASHCSDDGIRQAGVPCESMAAICSSTRRAGRRRSNITRPTTRLPRADPRRSAAEMDWHRPSPRRCCSATRTLGWMTVCSLGRPSRRTSWWRVVLIEAIARQAALALHHSRLVEHNRVEERRKAILEERNRLARDIHDNLAQGFAAILMQLQAAQREAGRCPPACGGEHRRRRSIWRARTSPKRGVRSARCGRTSATAKTWRPR